MNRLPAAAAFALFLLLTAAPTGAHGQQPDTTRAPRDSAFTLAPLLVEAERAFTPSSSTTVRALDLHLRPRSSSQDLLALVPGIVVVQHAGGGKAEQIFLRGFDADHGTDVAITLDGVPVNMVSHAHGQGYSDLHFLIPEVVEAVAVRKGPYDAGDGDFATAGAVDLRTATRIDDARVSVEAGSFGARRALALVPVGGDETRAGGYVAASLRQADGPFVMPQGHRRLNLFAKGSLPLGDGALLDASVSAFDATWRQSGQLPARAVRDGRVDRFGSLDDSEGGETRRLDVSVGLTSSPEAPRPWSIRAWSARYDFDLRSNFTYFLNDPVDGDGIRQIDRRWLGGAHTRMKPTGEAGPWTLGAGFRVDRARVGLFDQARGITQEPRALDDVDQEHLFGWVSWERRIGPGVRVRAGLRGDALRFAVRDLRDGGARREVSWRAIASPKAGVAWDVAGGSTLFAAAGAGFHSNHARDVVLAGPDDRVLPRALGAELGWRRTWRDGTLALTAWRLDLESELIYVGDEGVTEPSGRTVRRGVDLELRARVVPRLWADLDVSASAGRFPDAAPGERLVPLAPTRVVAGGLTWRASSFDAGLRGRHLGSRPADESGHVIARGSTLLEVFGSARLGPTRLRIAVDNLLDRAWNEAQFATTSRLRGEPADGVTELHFTPGAPRSLVVALEWTFR